MFRVLVGSRRVVVALLLGLSLLLPSTLGASAATPNRVYFPQTGQYLAYGFLNFWLQHGQLMNFGYPITGEFTDSQSGLTVQYFERAVFEYHPNNSPGWRVELRRLGAMAAAGRQNEAPFQPIISQSDANCDYYNVSNHQICLGFRDFWNQHGGLPVFGYPLSEEFQENGYTVQYFERAIFEYHPSNSPGWQVELRLLGDAAAEADHVNTAPLGQSATVPAFSPDLWPTCAPSQLSAGFGMGEGAAGSLLQVVTLQNTSGETCQLYGYPGMLLLDAHGNPLPTTVHRGGYAILSSPPQSVYLTPGDYASFDVIYHHIPAGTESCVTSSQVEITPPNDFSQLVVPWTIQACGGDLYVSPVVLGAQGAGS